MKLTKPPSDPKDATSKEWVEANTTKTDIKVYAQEPATSLIEGDQFWVRNGMYIEAMISGAWLPFGPIRELNKPPLVSTLTAENIDDSVTDESRGGIRLISGTPANEIRGYWKAKTFNTPWYVEAAFLNHGQINTSGDCGIFVRNGDGRIMTCSIAQNGSFRVDKWTDFDSFSVNAKTDSMGLGIPFVPHWLRIRDNGTDIFFDFSYDLGTTWLTRYKEARATFFTLSPGGPTQVGFFVNDANSAGGAPSGGQAIWLYHWKEVNA